MWRRCVAAVLLLVGVLPTLLLVVEVLINGNQGISPAALVYWLVLGEALLFYCLPPLLGFGLLGLAVWRQSRRLAVAGWAAVVASGFFWALAIT
jgi:hypothetical protein